MTLPSYNPVIIWPKSFPEIETERLLLRRVGENDSTGIFRCFSDNETMRYMGSPLDDPDSVSGIVEDYTGGFEEGCSLIWTLQEKSTGLFTGTAGFEQFSFLDLHTEIGFTLLEEFRGSGLMREALDAIMKYGFDIMGLNRIQAKVLPENAPALRLLGELGLKVEGHLRKSVFFNGGFHDELMLAILREDR